VVAATRSCVVGNLNPALREVKPRAPAFRVRAFLGYLHAIARMSRAKISDPHGAPPYLSAA
jgi:hypothetical protein